MLANFNLDAAALADLGKGDPPQRAKREHDLLIERIHAHGFLVMHEEQIRTILRLLKEPDRLPPGKAAAWRTLLTEYVKDRWRFEQLKEPLWDGRGPDSLAALRVSVRDRADIVVLSDTEAERLGVGFEDDPAVPEVTKAGWASSCSTVTRLQELAEVGHTRSGANRSELWDLVLRPLAERSKTAVVIDPYLYKDLWNGRWRRDPGHVVWLVDNLNRTLRGGKVTLIGGGRRGGEPTQRPEIDAEETLNLIRTAWRRYASAELDRISELEVVLVPPTHWNGQRKVQAELPHDRHIRFGVGPAIILNSGVDRLSATEIWDKDGLNWSYRWRPDSLEPLRRAEERCQRVAGADRARWALDG